ncbi:MAG: invasion associated locus B family protein, partial [Rhodobacterales bacterium]
SLFKVDGSSEVAAGATFVVPLETLLTQKLTIAVDTGPAKRYDFSFCTQVGCYARVGFTSAEMAAFKAGVAGKVTIVPALAPDQKVTLDMSLSGFTAAYDQITSIKQ